jgi:ubiquinone/menaquinone biosynthesis C-methylase UbiE
VGNIEKFDSIASQYDTSERSAQAAVIAERIRQTVGDATGKTLIDYGCGTGLVGMRLLDAFRHVLLVDASPNMVEVVKRKIEDGRAPNAAVILCDLLGDTVQGSPPGLRGDYIIVVQVLLHISDVGLLLSRLRPLLNEGGHLLIVDFDKNDEIVSNEVHPGFDQQALAETMRQLGFQVEKSQTFYHGEGIFMNKDASLFMLDALGAE